MPGGGLLKLTSISHNNWIPRTTTTTTTGRKWWCRISPYAPSVHLRKPQASYNSSCNRATYLKQKGFGFCGGEKFLHLEDCSDQKARGYNSHYPSSTGGPSAPHMGPTPADYYVYDDGKKPPPPSSVSPRLLTLPTILTIGRVAAVPLLIATFYVDSWWGPNVTTCIFIAAAITDWLDGYLARKMNQGTAFGAFLDPVADKLMVAATLVLLCTKPLEAGIFAQAPWLLTVPAIAIIGREITMSAVREWAASQNGKLSEAVAVNNLGKWKTATQMTALTILLATRDTSLIGAGTLMASGVILLYISAWLSLWSLFVYTRKIWKVLLM